MRRRGSTIAECIFTLALCVTIMAAATMLYSFASARTLDSVGLLETSDGTDRLARELDFLISNAIDAEVRTIDGRQALKLTMPYEKGTRNANGFYDTYSASFMHPRLGDVLLDGERIWIYCGTNNASISTAGNIPMLARRTDDATPSISDVDWLWTYQDGAAKTIRRSPGSFSFAFSEDSTMISWTISSRSSSGANSAAIDLNNETTFRDLQVNGGTQIRLEAPQ